jgi:hypothetical protein
MASQISGARAGHLKHPHPLDSPSNTYGGMFDLANVDQTFPETDLKFMALFYDAVVVPDAFLMSYTPLFRHVDRLVKTRSDPDQDIISVFLSEGIIVPVIRRGDSLLENWTGSDPYIVPATEMRVRTDEGKRVLEFVDRNVTRYTQVDLKPPNRLADLLNEFLVGEEKPLSRAFSLLASPDSPRVTHLLKGFEDMVQGGLEDHDLRRLHIERLISGHLIRQYNFSHRRGFVPELYEKLNKAAASKPRDPCLFACQFLLNCSSTIYQAYHAHQFAALGGLFPFHDRGLIDAGLYNYLATSLPGKVLDHRREPQVKRAPVLFGSLNVSDLTPGQIVEIRKTEEFERYVSLLSSWKQPNDDSGQTVCDANPAFVDHLKEKYLPMLMKRFPEAVQIKQTIKAVGIGTAILLEVIDYQSFDCVSIAGRPIIAKLKEAAAIAIAHYSDEIAHALQSWGRVRRGKKFLKRNQYWAKTGAK